MDTQGVMSVAMVILEGANSAQRLHDHVMTALNPKYIQLLKQLKKDRKPLPTLHYADMMGDHRRIVAGRLAEANVTVLTAHHRHQGEKTHAERFSVYGELVKICVRSAFETHKELIVGVAKQGGWQKYEQGFCAELRLLPEEFTKQGNYRKADFELLSAARPGIQLADFYVGAVRDFTMNESLTVPFDLIQEQVLTRAFHVLEVVESER